MLAIFMIPLAWLLSSAPSPLRSPASRSATPTLTAASAQAAEAEAALLRLAAITDRGQRTSAVDRSELLKLVAELEATAPLASAPDLNGEWRLACAIGETPYRSSPFFWAFRQATQGLTTPIAIPGAEVQAGDAVASAVYGITDSIPFYDIGSVVQRISGVCSDLDGCEIEPDEDIAANGDDGGTPSDGDGVGLPAAADVGTLESSVQVHG